jgi:hypothetical protein
MGLGERHFPSPLFTINRQSLLASPGVAVVAVVATQSDPPLVTRLASAYSVSLTWTPAHWSGRAFSASISLLTSASSSRVHYGSAERAVQHAENAEACGPLRVFREQLVQVWAVS